MKEERYRTYKLILLTIFVGGALVIGCKLSESVRQLAENGRYIQYDVRKDWMPEAKNFVPTEMVDTRTGAVQPLTVITNK